MAKKTLAQRVSALERKLKLRPAKTKKKKAAGKKRKGSKAAAARLKWMSKRAKALHKSCGSWTAAQRQAGKEWKKKH